MADDPTPWGGWEPAIRDDPFPHFAAVRADVPGPSPCALADGHDAWVVLGHDAARQALNDPRLSKDMLAALADDPRRRRRGPARPGLRPPHAGRRSAGPHPPAPPRGPGLPAVAGGRARAARSRRIADDLLDELGRTGPGRPSTWSPATPTRCPFRVISELLGVPEEDQPRCTAGSAPCSRPWHGDAAARGRRGVRRHRRLPRRPRGRQARAARPTTWSSVLVAAERRGRPARRAGAAVEPLPADRRRPRHDHQPASATASSPCSTTPTSSLRCGPTSTMPRRRRRGAAPLRRAGPPRHLPDDHRGRHASAASRSPPASRSWSAWRPRTATRRAYPDPDRLDLARPARLAPRRSVTASTSASAPRWPGSRPGSPSPRLLDRFPDLRLAVPRDDLQLVPRRRPRAPRARRAAPRPRRAGRRDDLIGR